MAVSERAFLGTWCLLCLHGRSGFEGSWVTTPTRWTNQFFRNLLQWDWEVHVGPGGHHQWRPVHKPSSTAAAKAEPLPDIMSECAHLDARCFNGSDMFAKPGREAVLACG
jgi:hypothetical protein